MPRSRRSTAGLAAAALSGAVAVLYLALIAEGTVSTEGAEVRVGLFAAAFVAMPVCAALGALRPDTNGGLGLLVVAAVGMTVLGVLGLASIGLPLLLGAACAWGAVARSARGSGT